jgi:hypothetical protein
MVRSLAVLPEIVDAKLAALPASRVWIGYGVPGVGWGK